MILAGDITDGASVKISTKDDALDFKVTAPPKAEKSAA